MEDLYSQVSTDTTYYWSMIFSLLSFVVRHILGWSSSSPISRKRSVVAFEAEPVTSVSSLPLRVVSQTLQLASSSRSPQTL